jgi:hypothetical protein
VGYFMGMKPSLFSRLVPALFAGCLGVSSALAEGEVGSQAYAWTGYSDLAPTPQTYSLANYQGKVVLMVVFQYSCGGCLANAPRFGRLADSLDRGPDSAKFQAIGTEIFTATYSQIQNYRLQLTNNNALTLNFPLVKVPHDTAIAANDGTGEKWKRYNSYRDVYFVIDHTGKITARVEGNRANSMTNTQYNNLRAALNTAIAAVPVGIHPAGPGAGKGFRVMRRGGAFVFDAGAFDSPVTLRILDLQGRNIRTIVSSKTGSITWDGKDAGGKPVPFGAYFVRASDGTVSSTQRITILP